jgi:two-component system, OmpR family, sensor kinase
MRWTLRARLVAAILALTTLALAAANVLGITLLGQALMVRVDKQLDFAGSAGFARSLPVPVTAKAAPLEEMLVKQTANIARILSYDAQGRLLWSLPSTDAPGPVIEDFEPGGPRTVPGADGTPSWRIKVSATPDGGFAVVANSLAEIESTQRTLSVIAAAVSLGVLILLGLAADFLVRLGLGPLTRMQATAGHIAGGDFARRVSGTDGHTETGRLATAMNVMLDRVEHEIAARTASESRMRRFLADASHELRTPLTSVRGFAELHRYGGGDTDRAMRRIEDEAARMGALVNDLFTLAQLDEERPLERRTVDLLEVAADTIRDARARVPGRQVRLSGLGDALAPVTAIGDEARLRQVAANLVGNALTHTPPEAAVTVRVGPAGGAAVLEVADTGPGIDARHVPYLFDRLYRVGQGRTRTDGGAGLGLSIVAAIVRQHGGRVEIDTAPGRGATFRVFLPAVEAAPSSL